MIKNDVMQLGATMHYAVGLLFIYYYIILSF